MVARTKSFTGCWTCRARKIKCDLGEPQCQQCLRSKITCEGYTIRLCWAGKDKSESRRTLDPVEFPPGSMYDTYEEMDAVLNQLDSSDPAIDTHVLGPFAVFRGTEDSSSRTPGELRRRSTKGQGSRSKKSTPSVPSPASQAESSVQTSVQPHDFSSQSQPQTPLYTPSQSSVSLPLQEYSPGMPLAGQQHHQQSHPHPHQQAQVGPHIHRGSLPQLQQAQLIGQDFAQSQQHPMPFPQQHQHQHQHQQHLQHQYPHQRQQQHPLYNQNSLQTMVPPPPRVLAPDLGNSGYILGSGSANSLGLGVTSVFNSDGDTAVTSPYQEDVQSDEHNFLGLDDDFLFDMLPEAYSIVPESPARYSDALDLLFEKLPPQNVPYLPQKAFPMYRGSVRLTALAQCLLCNYYVNLVPYMSVVKHPHNIWRTLYTPRAISAVGDIIATGSTTGVRYTVLHAVAAASAYHLLHSFQEGSLGYAYYLDLGQRLHDASRMWLTRCFKRSNNIGKYKDFLVALSSLMVTEFIRGDSSGGDMAIVAAQRLINLRLLRRPKVSRKAMMLHRTCAMSILFSRAATLPDTASDSPNPLDDDKWLDSVFAEMSPKQSNAHQHLLETLEQLDSRQRTLSYMENQSELEDYFSQYNVDTAYSDAAASMELMYGLPSSLAYLFKESVKISREALRQREYGAENPDSTPFSPPISADSLQRTAGASKTNSGSVSGSANASRTQQGRTQGMDDTNTPEGFDSALASKCTALEAQLASWRHQYHYPEINYEVLRAQTPEGKKARWNAVIVHHTIAFYDALVIYHYRVAKDVNPDLLQPYVRRVIENLEAIMDLNAQHDSLIAIPFSFTGFVGACEVALGDTELRARYDKWFQAMQASGLSTYGPQVQVVAEIYRRRQAGQLCDWWTLIRERSVNLNLH